MVLEVDSSAGPVLKPRLSSKEVNGEYNPVELGKYCGVITHSLRF